MAMKLTTGKRIAETSSKGNQEKWRDGGRWYKLDLFGYEGLAETVASRLLEHTNLRELGFSFVPYRMEQLEVHRRKRTGCSSPDFLQEGEAILTLAELFRKGVGPNWQAQVSRLPNLASRVRWMADTTRRLTGLDRFGEYLTALFEADMLFGNEDRHLNNIAVLRRGGGFAYCPFFDFGAGLLSNTRDFPLDVVLKALVGQLRAQPLGTLFARQVHAAQGEFCPPIAMGFHGNPHRRRLGGGTPLLPPARQGASPGQSGVVSEGAAEETSLLVKAEKEWQSAPFPLRRGRVFAMLETEIGKEARPWPAAIGFICSPPSPS